MARANGAQQTASDVVYLAVQLYDSELEAQRAIAQNRQERNMEINLALSAELGARWNSTYPILYVDKLLSADREQFERTFRDGFSEPLIRFWWEFNKSSYNPDAVRYVDNRLAQKG